MLKVSKFKKQILKFPFEPKNKRKCFSIFAIVSNMVQIIKKNLGKKKKNSNLMA